MKPELHQHKKLVIMFSTSTFNNFLSFFITSYFPSIHLFHCRGFCDDSSIIWTILSPPPPDKEKRPRKLSRLLVEDSLERELNFFKKKVSSADQEIQTFRDTIHTLQNRVQVSSQVSTNIFNIYHIYFGTCWLLTICSIF